MAQPSVRSATRDRQSECRELSSAAPPLASPSVCLPPVRLPQPQIVFGRLWDEAFYLFCAEYQWLSQSPPAGTVTQKSSRLPRDDGRGVAGYVGGYCVSKKIARATKAGPKCAERLVVCCVRSRSRKARVF
eukprot:5307820-Prymnesium_polylepis.1